MCLSLHRADARCAGLMHEVFEEAVARGLLQLHAKDEHAGFVDAQDEPSP
jgi:hypothetical protein